MTWNSILYTLFAGTCVSCLERSHRNLDLCTGCQRDLPRIRNPCWQCGLPNTSAFELCEPCRTEPRLFSHIFSSFSYEWPIDQMVHAFKFNNNIAIGRVLSTLLARRYIRQHILRPDLWVPVPLHPSRLRQRGFNQAENIANVLADETGVPIDTQLISRTLPTESQAGLSAVDRIQNVDRAFSINKPIHHQSIGIVDDVVTTASTVTELTRCLLEHGARDVQIVCLARTPEK